MDKTENRFYREAAFPSITRTYTDDDGETTHQGANGMTLRDYFAAKAMQGMVANPEIIGDPKAEIVREAYEFADEMLLAREN